MKALVLEENGKLVWREHELRRVDGWYRMRIAAAGICGSDLGRGFKGGAYHYPLVMGHEFSAVVEEAHNCGKYAPGTLAAVYPLLPCGKCAACAKGWIQLCEHYDYFGSRRDGAFAEELYVPESHILPVPDGVTAEEAAMTEPAAVAYHGTHGFHMEKGARALVIGGGPIGLIAAQWLRIRGAGEVAIADIDPAKLEFAARFGFGGVDKGEYDVVVEACGVSATRTMAVERCARKGVVSFIGNPADDWTFAKPLFSIALRKELTMRGNWNSVPDPDWRGVLAHAGKDLNLKDLVTACVPMAEGAAAFERILARDGFHCKTLLVNHQPSLKLHLGKLTTNY
ncbi:MAG: galactitol-1-phosphate 5-dehydrogenase [Kiritimatiellae bacterium]|nr:galactitol-1-phosphate 5-dehydrogenase [Kiritimatiellia bacterium]